MAYQSSDEAAFAVTSQLSDMFRELEAMPTPQRFLSLLDQLEAEDALTAFEAALPTAVGF
jgi:hypothetical protein